MTGQQVGYVRVSSEAQNTARQLEGVKLDRCFEDRLSGKSTNRPELTRCLDHLRDGDTLHVHSMDRLARNLGDLRKIVDGLTARGVAVRFHKEGLVFTGEDSPMSQLLLNLLGAVAEFERSLIRERQQEGIEIAKRAGVYKGRRKSLDDQQVSDLRIRAAAGEQKTALAKAFGISRESVYQYLRA